MVSNYDEKTFFKLRQEGKIYISKVFKFSSNSEEVRNVHIVFENSNQVSIGEINGAIALRKSATEKQQVLAVVSQDDKNIKSLTLQKFRESESGDFNSSEKEVFSFYGKEFNHLNSFLQSIKFLDLSNRENHQIQDLSTNSGNKAIVDSFNVSLLNVFENLDGSERFELLEKIKEKLTKDDIQTLLGRKEAVEIFKQHLEQLDWLEALWQDFFDKQSWIFGIGLDYKILRPFDREMNATAAGTDNKEKSILDFLLTFNDFTVTVEIKKPNTPIFDKRKSGRSGIWAFHSEFIEAYSQVLEQKAEWHITGQKSDLYNKDGSKKLSQRTRDAKAILVIGNKQEFLNEENVREREIKQDTFELFRRDSRNVEIVTFDELYERARFIIDNKKL